MSGNVWLKFAFFQFVVSVWQSRHAPGKWLGGGTWQLEQSAPPIWLWSNVAFFQLVVSLWHALHGPP